MQYGYNFLACLWVYYAVHAWIGTDLAWISCFKLYAGNINSEISGFGFLQGFKGFGGWFFFYDDLL